jgi:hypothetical protein
VGDGAVSLWVRAVCRRAVDFTAEELAAGIGRRLDLLIAMYCPDDEEPTAAVLARLQVAQAGPDAWAID